MDQINLRYMMVFMQVVDSGSISGAADVLAISKSVVSQQLKQLEQSLGVSLLNRTTRSQILTPAGKDFYAQCQRIGRISQQAWNDAQASQRLAVGPVTISAPHALVNTIVAPAIASLLAEHPRIKPTILANDQRVNLLEEGVDLAVRVGDMPASNLRQRLLGHFSDVLCADAGYVTRAGISEEQLVTGGSAQAALDYIANAWQGGRIHHHFIHAETDTAITLDFTPTRFADSLPAVMALLQGGCGIAFVPDFYLAQQVHGENVVDLLPHYHSQPVAVYGVHGFGKHLPYVIELCMNAIKSRMDVGISVPLI